MIEENRARVFIGAMNLLVAGSPMLISQGLQAATPSVTSQTTEELNVTSLQSIESAWLKLPKSCKARGFNASPVSVEHRELSSQIQNIYASFGA